MGTTLAGQRILAANLNPGPWTSLGTLAGYTATGRYRSLPNGDTELDLSMLGGGANAATVTFSVTLPPALALNNGASSTAYPLAVNGALSGGTSARVIVASSGSVTISYVANHTQLLTGQCFIPTS